jgi:hypothetical protein
MVAPTTSTLTLVLAALWAQAGLLQVGHRPPPPATPVTPAGPGREAEASWVAALDELRTAVEDKAQAAAAGCPAPPTPAPEPPVGLSVGDVEAAIDRVWASRACPAAEEEGGPLTWIPVAAGVAAGIVGVETLHAVRRYGGEEEAGGGAARGHGPLRGGRGGPRGGGVLH